MKEQFAAQVLTAYVGEQDQYHGGPLYAAIVGAFQKIGIAGVTVLHGIEGYGGSGHIHSERILILFEGLPVVVQAVDTPQRIAEGVAALDGMITGGMVTIQDALAFRYTK